MRNFQQGDWVKVRDVSSRHGGARGRIHATYNTCPYEEESLIELTDWWGENAIRFINQGWFGVLKDGGSSLIMPNDLLEEIEPFSLSHPWYTSYFNDAPPRRSRSIPTGYVSSYNLRISSDQVTWQEISVADAQGTYTWETPF